MTYMPSLFAVRLPLSASRHLTPADAPAMPVACRAKPQERSYSTVSVSPSSFTPMITTQRPAA